MVSVAGTVGPRRPEGTHSAGRSERNQRVFWRRIHTLLSVFAAELCATHKGDDEGDEEGAEGGAGRRIHEGRCRRRRSV